MGSVNCDVGINMEAIKGDNDGLVSEDEESNSTEMTEGKKSNCIQQMLEDDGTCEDVVLRSLNDFSQKEPDSTGALLGSYFSSPFESVSIIKELKPDNSSLIFNHNEAEESLVMEPALNKEGQILDTTSLVFYCAKISKVRFLKKNEKVCAGIPTDDGSQFSGLVIELNNFFEVMNEKAFVGYVPKPMGLCKKLYYHYWSGVNAERIIPTDGPPWMTIISWDEKRSDCILVKNIAMNSHDVENQISESGQVTESKLQWDTCAKILNARIPEVSYLDLVAALIDNKEKDFETEDDKKDKGTKVEQEFLLKDEIETFVTDFDVVFLSKEFNQLIYQVTRVFQGCLAQYFPN